MYQMRGGVYVRAYVEPKPHRGPINNGPWLLHNKRVHPDKHANPCSQLATKWELC